MLFLVGIGLAERDISLKAIEICKDCDLFIDRYTSMISDQRVEYLATTIGKQITTLSRSDMEEGSRQIIERARSRDVAILIGGDPLTATTHKILYTAAKKLGVRVLAVHSSSIFSAALGESGLDFYRFGQVCTIPKWSAHYSPVSFYETISRNMKSNQHSLLLLDYDPVEEKSLSINEAVDTLEKAEQRYQQGVILDKTKLFVLHNVSMPTQKNIFTTIAEAKALSISNGTSVLILPASLSDIEKEVIASMYG
ncbi:MAG: diphthine synthase [Candidatus Micrarchaeaceae archaeon]